MIHPSIDFDLATAEGRALMRQAADRLLVELAGTPDKDDYQVPAWLQKTQLRIIVACLDKIDHLNAEPGRSVGQPR